MFTFIPAQPRQATSKPKFRALIEKRRERREKDFEEVVLSVFLFLWSLIVFSSFPDSSFGQNKMIYKFILFGQGRPGEQN